MNQYELLLIFTPVLSDDEIKSAVKRYTDLITENKGEIVSEEIWGLRQLAYPIQKKTTGIYVILEYKAPGDVNAKMDVQFYRDDQVMRHMITALDKYAIEFNERRRNGDLGKHKKAQEALTQEVAQDIEKN
jgi:small subunit ribosomal protein S6